MSIITFAIIGITVLTSFRAFQDPYLKQQLLFYPYSIKRLGEYYRFISAGLVHADGLHLGINMFVLYMFGTQVENIYSMPELFGQMGSMLFLLLYLGGIASSELYSYFQHQDHSYYRSLGASGAVSAVLMCFILFAPWTPLTFVFFPFFDFPAIVLGVLYMAYSYWAARNANDNIGHNAHFYGGIFGILFTLVLKPSVGLAFVSQLLGGL